MMAMKCWLFERDVKLSEEVMGDVHFGSVAESADARPTITSERPVIHARMLSLHSLFCSEDHIAGRAKSSRPTMQEL